MSLEIVGALIAGVVGIMTIVGGVVGGVRWVVKASTGEMVASVRELSGQVKSLGESIDRLWTKSDEGEKLHREHAEKLSALTVRVDGLRPKRRVRHGTR